jgi:colicin import membrane protein
MIEIIKEHPRAVMFAAIFHLIVVIVVGVSVDWTSVSKPTGDKKPVKIVNAVAVDQKILDNELKKIKQAEKKRVKKQKDAERRKKQAIVDRKREEKKLKDLKLKSKKEKARQLKLKKKRKADLKAEKKRKQKAKKKKQKADAEKKRKAAKLTEQQQRQEKFERELKNKLDKEEAERQAVIAAANSAKRQSEIGKYKDKIKAHIESKWISTRKEPGKISIVTVKVLPGGGVANVKLKKSSGDSIFDSDAINAVYNADPLPVPSSDSDLINEFRKFTLNIGIPK